MLSTKFRKGTWKLRKWLHFFSSAFSTLPICNIYFWIWNYIKLFSNSLLWSILVCKLPQFFPKSYWFGQLIILLSCPNQLKSILSIIKCKLSFLILRTSLMCVRGSRSFTTHSGNHVVDDFQIAFDYTLGWDLLIWDLKGRVCFKSLFNNVYNFMFDYRFFKIKKRKKVDTMRLLKIYIMFYLPTEAKYPFFRLQLMDCIRGWRKFHAEPVCFFQHFFFSPVLSSVYYWILFICLATVQNHIKAVMSLICLEVLGEGFFCFPVGDWEGICRNLLFLVKLYQRFQGFWIWNVFRKKGVLKNFAKFTRNTCTGVSFLKKNL